MYGVKKQVIIKTNRMKSIACISIALMIILSSSVWSHTIYNKYKSHFLHVNQQPRIQLAILLDTSGSMEGLIEQAKSQLWNIVNELATARYKNIQPSLEIALYEYGNDGISAKDDHVRMIVPFTTDLDKVSEELFKLTTNGGQEYCGSAIQKAVNDLNWSKSNDDLKIIYIAGNEPFNQGSTNYTISCKNAFSRGIIVNTVFCSNAQEGISSFWKDGAERTEGKYMNIDHQQSTVYIETPFDKELVQLNQQLNDTYIAYGEEGVKQKENQIRQDKNAESYGSATMAARTVSKSSNAYQNEGWDLVDASKDKSFNVATVREESLPAAMKGMSKEQKEKYIDEMRKKRESIQKQISEIHVKRLAFLKEKEKSSGQQNTLAKAMIESIREQATKKNYSFPSIQP